MSIRSVDPPLAQGIDEASVERRRPVGVPSLPRLQAIRRGDIARVLALVKPRDKLADVHGILSVVLECRVATFNSDGFERRLGWTVENARHDQITKVSPQRGGRAVVIGFLENETLADE